MAGKRIFSGVIAPLVTPFGEDGAPDPDRFIAHADWLMRNGCTGLAPFGTTSEANSLGLDERMELLEELVDAGIDAGQLLPGTGMCSVTDAITLTMHAVEAGCGGVLMLPPFYYKSPSEDGLFAYFSEVIEQVGDDRLKVYLYHIPPIAQVGIPVSLVSRLRKRYPDTIAGLKDSSGDWAQTQAFLSEHSDIEIFPGSEAYLLEGLRKGAAGTISASANINAAGLYKVFAAHANGEADADALQAKISGIRKVLQSPAMIPLIKGIIAVYRKDRDWARVRPPLIASPLADAAALVKTLEADHGFTMDFTDAA
jgi:4-hydroxy-tetrahydrodipicolinate synthase